MYLNITSHNTCILLTLAQEARGHSLGVPVRPQKYFRNDINNEIKNSDVFVLSQLLF